MATEHYNYGPVSVTIADIGDETQPWGRSGKLVTKYKVSVKSPRATYSSHAWGSIADFEQGKLDHLHIGAMVVSELCSAAADPDEFVEIVIGEAKGREALKLGKDAEKIVSVAEKFGKDIFVACDIIREKGLD